MSLDEIKHDYHFQLESIRLSALRIQSFRLKKQLKQLSCNCFNYDNNDINEKIQNKKNFQNQNYYLEKFNVYYNDYLYKLRNDNIKHVVYLLI